MTARRHILFPLLPAVALTLLCVTSTAAGPGEPTPVKPDRESLASREKALRRSDTHGAAKAELRAVRRWLVLAEWAGKEGRVKHQMLRLAELQLDLARRLVALSRMRAEVDRLKRSLLRTKKAIVEDRDRIKQRGEYLGVLRSTR
jgi:hypothetical protein